MNDDTVSGAATGAGGRIREQGGALFNDKKHEVHGLIDQARGSAQNLYGEVKDAVRAALEEASPRVREVSAAAVGTARKSPVLSTLAVGAVGALLAWVIYRGSGDRH